MKRAEAIKLIAGLKMNLLTKDERDIHLINWWHIDEDDKEFHSLPEELRKEMTENEMYGNPENRKYDPLILEALIFEFKGVRNEYIKRVLKKYTGREETIVGKIEQLEKCPCCDYKTLEERNEWDICIVCFWEDDGLVKNLDDYSGPNRMTLREAKQSFKKIGACEERLVSLREKEPGLKFEK